MKNKIKFTKRQLDALYSAAPYLNTEIERELGLQIPFDVYFQDPFVAEQNPELGFDAGFHVPLEPGLGDGPTSARFAVVDYIGDSRRLIPPAKWDDETKKYVFKGKVLDQTQKETMQFHQVHVWAILQRALLFFESGFGCGRRIPWGFDGNRLIVVPHAGYGKNAYYDRRSKSLQFYYFDNGGRRIFTCLSTDIINHEFGHAVLDGIRPYYSRTVQVETAAFHEFIGDITSILITMRNNTFRAILAKKSEQDLNKVQEPSATGVAELSSIAAGDALFSVLSAIAEQFGQEVRNRPYLRTANNQHKMSALQNNKSAHRLSEVMTGTMFNILVAFAAHFRAAGESVREAYWHAVERMQRVVIQPLDLLPPVDVTFRDYALAVLRAERIANPLDPHRFHDKMLEIFIWREILTAADRQKLLEPAYLYDRMDLTIFHDIDSISRSRAAAYRFLHDNRKDLCIPPNCDVKVIDLYDANKRTRQARQLPRQVVLQYLWEEPLTLTGKQYGQFNGRETPILCGGTLVFDQNGTIISWFYKPGTLLTPEGKKGKEKEQVEAHLQKGQQRIQAHLDKIASQVASGLVGFMPENPVGFMAQQVPPIIAEASGNVVNFGLAPHLHLSTAEDEEKGGRPWELSF